jgi:hypothetical protein
MPHFLGHARTSAVGATRSAHDAVCRATLSFLDAFVKAEKPAGGWNRPESSHGTTETLAGR